VSGPRVSAWHLVQETLYLLDLRVLDADHVEPDRERFRRALGAEVPSEPRDVVMAVDRAAQPEPQARELLLRPGDEPVDPVVPGDRAESV
jgi:hypothetical protein